MDPSATRVPWAGARAVVDAVGIYLGAQVGLGLLVALVGAGAGGGAPVPFLLLASPVALCATALLWLRLRYGPGAARVALGPLRGRDVAVGVGVGVACFVGQRIALVGIVGLLTALGLEVPQVQQTFQDVAADRSTAPLLAVAAVLLAPLAEELLFRGVVFRGLRARRGFWPAAVVSAALFTLAHLGEGGGPVADLIIVTGIFPLGLVFAAVMERRGSLVACAVTHAVYNAGGVALLLFGTAWTG